MDIYEIRRDRLRQLIKEDFEGNVAAFARHITMHSPSRTAERPFQASYVHRIFNNDLKDRRNLGEDLAREIEAATGRSPGWLDRAEMLSQPLSEYIVVPSGATPASDEFVLIPNNGWHGSCGGGRINWEIRLEKPLAFQKEWLTSRGVKMNNALLLYADGDSMKDFIVDGDVVLFDRSKTAIKSGEIYAIEHPEGTRIKRARMEFDGSLTLASDNADKNMFPDDHIPTSHLNSLRVLGQFVWRGGG